MRAHLISGLTLSLIIITFAGVAWAGPAATPPAPGSLVQASLAAIANATLLSDVTLTGTANFVAGSDAESGAFTIEAKGNQQSKLTLNLSGGTRQEIRSPVVAAMSSSPSNAGGTPRLGVSSGAVAATSSSPGVSGGVAATSSSPGAWFGADGDKHSMALHNCWIDASVYFPGLSLQGAMSDPQVSVVDAGPTLHGGATLDHLQITRTIPGQTPAMTAEIQSLSALDIYLDPTSHLPVAVAFNTHPDNTLTINIPVEIRFSDYRVVNGVQVAFHIQKFIQRTLTLDMTVTSATINSGLADSEFAL